VTKWNEVEAVNAGNLTKSHYTQQGHEGTRTCSIPFFAITINMAAEADADPTTRAFNTDNVVYTSAHQMFNNVWRHGWRSTWDGNNNMVLMDMDDCL
jgi:hypothetical protein